MARIFDYKEEEGEEKNIFYEHNVSKDIYIKENKPHEYGRMVNLKDGHVIIVSKDSLSNNYRPIPRFTTFSVEV